MKFTFYGTKREAYLVFAGKPNRYSLNQFSQVQSKHDDNAIAPLFVSQEGSNASKKHEKPFCSVNLNKRSVNSSVTFYGTKREAYLVFASKPERYSLNQFSQVQRKHDDNAIAPY